MADLDHGLAGRLVSFNRKLSILDNSSTQLANYVIPNGIAKTDEAFGEVEVFYDNLNFNARN